MFRLRRYVQCTYLSRATRFKKGSKRDERLMVKPRWVQKGEGGKRKYWREEERRFVAYVRNKKHSSDETITEWKMKPSSDSSGRKVEGRNGTLRGKFKEDYRGKHRTARHGSVEKLSTNLLARITDRVP